MRFILSRIDSNGMAPDAGSVGVGFRVVPARAPSPAGPGTQARPGAYPITVELDDGRMYALTSGEAVYFDKGFRQIKLRDGESGDLWQVQVFEARGDGVMPGSQRSTVPVGVQKSTAVPTTSPTLSTDGIRVRPGTLGHTFYASGTLGSANVWVRDSQGKWWDSGDTIDFTAAAVAYRSVGTSGDRIALKAAAGGLLVAIDAEVGVG